MATTFRVPACRSLIRSSKQFQASRRRISRAILLGWGYAEQDARAIVRSLIPPNRRQQA